MAAWGKVRCNTKVQIKVSLTWEWDTHSYAHDLPIVSNKTENRPKEVFWLLNTQSLAVVHRYSIFNENQERGMIRSNKG